MLKSKLAWLKMPSWFLLQTDPAANLTFNLRLSDSELEAKEKLTLPFVFSKEKSIYLITYETFFFFFFFLHI